MRSRSFCPSCERAGVESWLILPVGQQKDGNVLVKVHESVLASHQQLGSLPVITRLFTTTTNLQEHADTPDATKPFPKLKLKCFNCESTFPSSGLKTSLTFDIKGA